MFYDDSAIIMKLQATLMNNSEQLKKSRKGSGAITLHDVARLAGVSPITASRVINKPDQVSRELRQRVEVAISSTGYVPNQMAGALASSKSKLIAAVVPSTVISVFNSTIEALNNRLFDAGYQLMIGQSAYSASREENLLDSVIGRRPDGIFLIGVMKPGKGRTRLVNSGIPVVESWDLTTTPIDMLIGFSHVSIGVSVAKFLISKGKQRFAVIRAEDERANRRTHAFVKTITKAGYPEPCLVNVGAERSIRGGRSAMDQILRLSPKVDAIFCSSDLLALGALHEALARHIIVPDQISIVGFGDVPFLGDMSPALTTVRINGEKIGEMGAQYLVNKAQGLLNTQPILDVGFSIIERDTT
jgi:LacI family gluconate utilization system Gnt-I transcriptional repressor